MLDGGLAVHRQRIAQGIGFVHRNRQIHIPLRLHLGQLFPRASCSVALGNGIDRPAGRRCRAVTQRDKGIVGVHFLVEIAEGKLSRADIKVGRALFRAQPVGKAL